MPHENNATAFPSAQRHVAVIPKYFETWVDVPLVGRAGDGDTRETMHLTTNPFDERRNHSAVDSAGEAVQDRGMPEVMLSVEEVAARLEVSRQSVYEYLWNGYLKGVKDPETRTWLIREESVRNFTPPPIGRPAKKSRRDHK
jgi:excisionase family DNA binding protein